MQFMANKNKIQKSSQRRWLRIKIERHFNWKSYIQWNNNNVSTDQKYLIHVFEQKPTIHLKKNDIFFAFCMILSFVNCKWNGENVKVYGKSETIDLFITSNSYIFVQFFPALQTKTVSLIKYVSAEQLTTYILPSKLVSWAKIETEMVLLYEFNFQSSTCMK